MTRSAVDLDLLSAASVRDGALVGRHVTVLGLARSGIALARFFADAGAEVTVYDRRPPADLSDAIEALGGREIELKLGPEIAPAATWANAELIAASPSVNPEYPTTEPVLRDALRAVVDAHLAAPTAAPALVSEVDLVLRMCPCPTIGVTGTKGKTTTSSLVSALLAADPAHPAILGGNIGIPLVERIPELTPQHRVVVELSELQLPTLSRGTTVAVYTNVTSDHLDRHGSLEAYRRVKRRLADLVEDGGALVINADDPVVSTYRFLGRGAVVTYRLDRPAAGGLGVEDGWIVASGVSRLVAAGGGPTETRPGGRIMPVAELAIPGRHNVSNAMAAMAAALLFGVSPDAIRVAAAGFTGVEHRLERVANVDGVQFVNDSQGTQPDAVIAALLSFERPLVLIAGGRDKGNDLSELAAVAAERADAAVLIGESGPVLAEMLRGRGMANVELAASLEAAVARAHAIARGLVGGSGPVSATSGHPGAAAPAALRPAVATVLLSPAAASFDMFVDYAARGRAFKAAVADLAERNRAVGSSR